MKTLVTSPEGGGEGTGAVSSVNGQTGAVRTFGGNEVIVDATGVASSLTTITAGLAAASAGQVVTVLPGTYTDKNLTANNVTVNFRAGSTLISTAATGTDSCFKFDSTHVFSIAGDGHFRIVNPSGSNGDVASPCIFSVAGGVTISVESGLLEGYQTDVSKVGQHFIACFDHTTSNSLSVLCSQVSGNLTVGAPDGITNVLGCFGLAFQLSGVSGTGNSFSLTCTGPIYSFYDANANSTAGQFFYTFKIESFSDIVMKKRVATCQDSLSFYKCVNWIVTAVVGCFKATALAAPDNLNVFANRITGINTTSLFSLDTNFGIAQVSCTARFVASSAGEPGGNGLNIDTSLDSLETSTIYVDIPYVVSTAVVKLYGLAYIRCVTWITSGNGFDAGSVTQNVQLGYMGTDKGFSQGNAPILSGVLEINPNIS